MLGWFKISADDKIRAIYSRNIKMVENYIRNGKLNINEEIKEGKRPLHYAARVAAGEITQYFLSVPGIEVDAVDESGLTPLMIAAKCVNIRPCEALIAHGADYQRKHQGKTSVELFDEADPNGFMIYRMHSAIEARKNFLAKQESNKPTLNLLEEEHLPHKSIKTPPNLVHFFKFVCAKLKAETQAEKEYFNDSANSQDSLLPKMICKKK